MELLFQDSTIDVEAIDIDFDGDIDLVLANRDSQQNFIYLNDGKLNFNKKIAFGSESENTRAVEVADINNDNFSLL